MGWLDGVRCGEVGNRPRELDGAVVAARGELHGARGTDQCFLGLLREVGERFYLARPHIGVRRNVAKLLKALALPQAGGWNDPPRAFRLPCTLFYPRRERLGRHLP